MNYEALVNLMETLRTHAVLVGPIRKSGDRYLSVSCVFAPWRHEKGKDTTPSMTINFGEGETSRAHCFACGYNGLLADMVAELHSLYPNRIGHLISAVMESEYSTFPVLSMNQEKRKDTVRFYDNELKAIGGPLPPIALAFLESKGCPPDCAAHLRLKWIETMQAEKADGGSYEIRQAILFPVFSNVDGRVRCIGAQARELNPGPTMPKYVTAFRFPSGRFFYGDHLLEKIGGREVFLLEGPLDTGHILSLGEWALGLFGVAMQKEKIEKLKKAQPFMIYVLLDPDKAGGEAAVRVFNAIAYAGLPVMKLTPPKDPKQLTRDDLLVLKRRGT